MSKRYPVVMQLAMALVFCVSSYQSLAADKFDVTVIANDLDHPWSLQELPNQPLNFLVTERSGGFKLVSELGFVDEIPLSLPDLFVSGQSGLFEVSLAPDFRVTREVFFSYACGHAAANSTCVARAELTPTRPMKVTGLRKIFVAQPLRKGAAHYGGRFAWLPDQTLLLTLGDGFDYREEAQNLSSHLGKVVRMTRTGEAAPGNPFPHQAGGFIYSYGHRNSQGIVYDSTTDTLWQHEHGPRGGDELNQLRAGKNYGWPLASYGIDYTGAMVTPYQELPGVVDPDYQWTPSLAPSDMALYNGEMFSEWQGALLITHLAGKRLQVLQQRQEAWQVVHQLTLAEKQRLRAVTVASDGAIYLLTDSAAGQLVRLSR